MSELRKDPLTGVWTIYAPVREARPVDFTPANSSPPLAQAADCPFCAGREDRTPPEEWSAVASDEAAAGLGWTVRVVPNLYPALDADPEEVGPADVGSPAPYEACGGFGGHEVVILSLIHI